MTTNEIKQLILNCTRFGDNSNQKDINETLNAVDELATSTLLQLTPIEDLCLYKDAIVKGKVCAAYNSNYIESGKEFKATMVELLITHEE